MQEWCLLVYMKFELERLSMKNILKNRNTYIVLAIALILLGIGYYFSTPKLVEIMMKDVITQVDNNNLVLAKEKFEQAKCLNAFVAREYAKQLCDVGIRKNEEGNYNSVQEIISFVEQLSPAKDTEFSKKLIAQGKAKMKAGLYDKAITYFDIAIIFDPSIADVYLQKGKAILKENKNCEGIFNCDYSEVIKLMNNAIDLDNNLAEAYVYRGIAYHNTSDTAEMQTKSLEDFNKAITLNSNKEATAIAYCFTAIAKFNEQDLNGFTNDRNIAMKLKREVGNITEYPKAFEHVNTAEHMMCALYDRCEFIH